MAGKENTGRITDSTSSRKEMEIAWIGFARWLESLLVFFCFEIYQENNQIIHST